MKWNSLLITGVLVLLAPSVAWAWGPATHVKLASDLLSQLHLIPAALAALLVRYHRDYLFGNIAADVVIAKRLSRVKQFCHHWSTGFSLLDDAKTDSSRAFAMGYLSHLAADTVAHNKYLPRQMALTRTTLSFGHLYWEMRADATIGPHYWEKLREILAQVFSEHRLCLSSKMNDTLLPFTVNWRMFYRMNRFVSQRFLRQAMDRWYRHSRWQLSDQLMREYRAECLERMVDVVAHGKDAAVLHEDPNGNAALKQLRVYRRQLRQMNRCGLAAAYVYREAARNHAPRLGTALRLRRAMQ